MCVYASDATASHSIRRRELIQLGAGALLISFLPETALAAGDDGEPNCVVVETLGNEVVTLADGTSVVRISLEARNHSCWVGEDYVIAYDCGALTCEVKFGDADGYLVGTHEVELYGWLPAEGEKSYTVDVPLPAKATSFIVKNPSVAERAHTYTEFEDLGLAVAILGQAQSSMDLLVVNNAVFEYSNIVLKVRLVDEDEFTVDVCEADLDLGDRAAIGSGEAVRGHLKVALSGDGWLDFSKVESFERSFDIGPNVTRLLFGRYPTEKGAAEEAIAWRVLGRDESGVLVITEKAIECRPYNSSYKKVTWSDCSLRGWLNGTFLQTAFSEGELGLIRKAQVENPDNPEYGTDGGAATEDCVFLLSIDEANEYFSSDADRVCYPTDLAVENGAHTCYGACHWWLRSPGGSSSNAAYVPSVGSVLEYGIFVDNDDFAVRPALWLDLES